MRSRGAFVLGALTAAAVVWLWGRQMKEYVGHKRRAGCARRWRRVFATSARHFGRGRTRFARPQHLETPNQERRAL